MRMNVKFESRSSRAKAVALHPNRPWLLVALYSSTIQLWDYRMGGILHRFEGHQGPVRGIDIHPTQEIFVSAGDDQAIRVWSLSEKRLLFSLEGHQDYIRTVFFHKTLPWIVSASDDQTVRVWDWQSRKEIATLTGHSHWVSCAVFHPTEDLIFSSSLDSTVRSWDISGLVKRHSAAGVVPSQLLNGNPSMNAALGNLSGLQVPGMPGSMPTGLNSSFGGGLGIEDDLLGEVTTNFIMEGHSRGVSWVDCHPTQPIIATASDDRTIKLWRFNGSVAWEMDTFRSHRDEVTSVVFNPYNDTLVSCSSDCTVKVWDLNNRGKYASWTHTGLVKGENTLRYWALRFHPKLNLLAAASDSGSELFKFGRERPVFVTSPEYYAVGCDLQLRDKRGDVVFDYKTLNLDLGQSDICRFECTGLSFNSAERTLLLSISDRPKRPESGIYLLHNLNTGHVQVGKSPCKKALFITRNRFCSLSADTKLQIRDMEDKLTREIDLPIETQVICPAQQGQVVLLGANSVVIYDIQQKSIVSKMEFSGARDICWSPSQSHMIIRGKHQIAIATKNLEHVATIDETIRVKSVAWDDKLPIVFYTTFSHLKYALLNGDTGILCTMEDTSYLIGGSKSTLRTVARNIPKIIDIQIDPTEYRFKLALITHNFAEVSRLIQNSNLVGQSIIAYLQKRGYPEIALEFVQDPQTKLDLAIESGNLTIAAEVAGQLQGAEFDEALEKAALEQGNHDILEDVYLRQRDFDKLAFLYTITGNRSRLQRLEQLASQRGDAFAQFQISLFLNSPDNRIALLKEAGQGALAYALAKTHGMDDEAEQTLEEYGKTVAEVNKITTSNASDHEVSVVKETYKETWPVEKLKTVSIMDMAKLSLNDSENQPSYVAEFSQSNGGAGAGGAGGDISMTNDDFVADEPVDVGDEWDLEEELDEEEFEDVPDVPAGEAESPFESWVRNSTVAADHIAAGSFETAGQLLNRQIGVCKFEALKSRFMDVYSASKLGVDGHDGLSPLPAYVYRNAENTLPFIPGYDHIQSKLNEAFTQVKSNQLELAVDTFRSVLHTAATLAVETEQEESNVKKAIETCKNYILAFSIEIQRRKLSKDDVKRNVELAAYFTKPNLRSAHAVLPLRTAVVQASNAKNYSLASHFAAEYLKIDSNSPHAEKMRKNKTRWDSAKTLDAVDIDFDMFAEFDVDPISLTPIYSGQPTVEDPLTHAKYHIANKGQVCAITGFTQVGAVASGLRLRG